MSTISVGAYAVGARLLAEATAWTSNDRNLPNVSHGVSCGDVSRNQATIWSRCDRAARMTVELATNEQFKNARRLVGPDVLQHSDFTGKVLIENLPDAAEIYYRVQFQDLDQSQKKGASVAGRLVPASRQKKDITFAWSGDTAGQGFGIDAAQGGMQTYAAMTALRPDFFVHSGDVCYADGPFPTEVKLDDGSIWKNVVTEHTAKVAESLTEFRANFRYNLLDKHVRRFNATVPIFAQWDDHETTNNWFPGEQLTNDDRYHIKSASLLAARAKQAFFEYLPIRPSSRRQIYRTISRGPLLDLFFLDLRSFKGPNSTNRQLKQGPESAFMGVEQLRWLKGQLASSTATWKFICSDMPIGLIVGDGMHFENASNGDGNAVGRELEIAELLRHIKHKQIKNVVFLTADVHYAASHHFDPNRAQFTDFNPFWEFVSGPLHAGTFGPNPLDNTFGPAVKFCSVDKMMKPNRPPSDGLQFFGLVNIDGQTESASVAHYDRDGQRLWSVDLEPE